MIFFAYLGNKQGKENCLKVMRRHAQWLSLNVCLVEDESASAEAFACGWLQRPETPPTDLSQIKIEGDLFLSTLGFSETHEKSTADAFWNRLVTDLPGNSSWVRIGDGKSLLKIVVPPATPEQIYYCQDNRGLLVSNDLRAMRLWANPELNEAAVFSLFQFGTIPLSMSIFQKICRIPPAYLFEYDALAKTVHLEPSFLLERFPSDACDEVEAEDLIGERVDAILGDLPKNSALFFSGGTDSSLLAARMMQLGRTDIPLINYSFGPEDEQAQHAEKIARHLGMQYERIEHRQQWLPAMLDRIGMDYSYPFGDNSVIPTNFLVYQSLEYSKDFSTVIDGTGADGSFGIGLKIGTWQRLYQFPRLFRMMGSCAYHWAGIWKRDGASSKIEAFLRAARRSVQMPLLHAAIIAQNPLDGIAYKIPQKIRREIEEEYRHYFAPLVEGRDLRDQCSFLDMLQVCGGAFAAKVFDPLRRHGIRVVFPFMDPCLLRRAYSLSWEKKCHGGNEKSLLKKLLKRQLPKEMIDRPKVGFLTPVVDVFADQRMQEYFREAVLSNGNPISSFLRQSVVEKMIERAKHRQPLSVGTRNFLWAIAFTSAWLEQQSK